MEQLSLDQLLAPVPPHLLDQKITNDIHLADIARSLGNWKATVAYLGLSEADEEAIEEENPRVDGRRLVLFAAVSQIVCACTNTWWVLEVRVTGNLKSSRLLDKHQIKSCKE